MPSSCNARAKEGHHKQLVEGKAAPSGLAGLAGFLLGEDRTCALTKKKLVIFDLDGTLVDAYPAIAKSFNAAMRAFGYPSKSASIIRRAVGWGDRNLLKPFVRSRDLARVLKTYRISHARDLIKYARWMPHALCLLEDLRKRGFALAIASNRPTRFTRIVIKALTAKSLFNVVLCADRLKYGKPNPLILREILRKQHIAKQDALYVGDMGIDMQTGRRAGIRTVAIATGSSHLRELKREHPDYLFRDLAEFHKMVKEAG